jgi:hypothetical protein
MSKPRTIRDRIKDFRRVKASELFASPHNWRTHPKAQQAALLGVLEEIGYADALLARELPDGTLELVDGHLRKETTPDQEVPVLILDIDEDEAKKLLAVIDPLAAMAEANADALGSLLAEIGTESDALQAMLDELADYNGIGLDGGENDPEAEWEGMPEFENEDKSGIRAIIHFDTEEDQQAFEKLVGQKIPRNTKSIWYPAKERAKMAAMSYEHES